MIGLSALFALSCRALVRFPGGRFPWVLSIWVAVATFAELLGITLAFIVVDNTQFYNFYWPVEFGLLLTLGQLVYPRKRWLVWLIASSFLVVWVSDLVRVWPTGRLATASVIWGALLLTGFYLAQLWTLAETWSADLREAPAVWLCLAVLVYYGPAAPLIGSINYFIVVDMDLASKLYGITQVLCVLKFIIMGIACLRMGRQRTANSST